MTVSSHRQKLMDPYRVCRREQRELGKNPVWHWQDGKQWLFSFHGVYMFNAMHLTLNCVLLKRTLVTQWLSRFLEALIWHRLWQLFLTYHNLCDCLLRGGWRVGTHPTLIFGSSRDLKFDTPNDVVDIQNKERWFEESSIEKVLSCVAWRFKQFKRAYNAAKLRKRAAKQGQWQVLWIEFVLYIATAFIPWFNGVVLIPYIYWTHDLRWPNTVFKSICLIHHYF